MPFRSRPAAIRFWEKVNAGPRCWTWTAHRTRKGYGLFHDGTKLVAAHRWVYEAERGPIPPGLTIDHLCRNRACVNPAHLEVVPNAVNVLRGIGPTARNARATKCAHGHPYEGRNLIIRRTGWRRCRACHNRETSYSVRKRES